MIALKWKVLEIFIKIPERDHTLSKRDGYGFLPLFLLGSKRAIIMNSFSPSTRLPMTHKPSDHKCWFRGCDFWGSGICSCWLLTPWCFTNFHSVPIRFVEPLFKSSHYAPHVFLPSSVVWGTNTWDCLGVENGWNIFAINWFSSTPCLVDHFKLFRAIRKFFMFHGCIKESRGD